MKIETTYRTRQGMVFTVGIEVDIDSPHTTEDERRTLAQKFTEHLSGRCIAIGTIPIHSREVPTP